MAGRTITTGQCCPGATPGDGSTVELDQEGLRALTDALMADIAGLSGQEYVDVYASRKRKAPGEGEVPARTAPSS